MREAIFEMYKQLPIGKSGVCLECKESIDLENPLSYYYIGEKFHSSDDNVLFVGKTAVGGDIGDFIDNKFTDATSFGEESLDLKERMSTQRAIYSYTHEIIKRYYGSYEQGKKYIALTNMMKCNDGSTSDNTTFQTKINCIEKLGVIWKEIEILKPKRIVFYTGRHYDYFIKKYQPTNCLSPEDIEVDESNCWLHRRILYEDKTIACDILRTYHPQRRLKEEFISKVVTWLNQTK